LILLDQRHHANRESISALLKEGEEGEDKRKWMCVGEFFIKMSKKDILEELRKDQTFLLSEKKRVEKEMKEKTIRLHKLEGLHDRAKGMSLNPLAPEELRKMNL